MDAELVAAQLTPRGFAVAGVAVRSNDVSLVLRLKQRERAAKNERYGDRFGLIGTPAAIMEQIVHAEALPRPHYYRLGAVPSGS